MTLFQPETISPSTLPSVSFGARSALPDVPAIYFVLDGARQVQYIGRSRRLNIRWRSHHRLVAFQQIPDLHIAYLTMTDASLLREVERALIRYFEPPLNGSLGADEKTVVTTYQPVTVRIPLHIYEEICDVASAEDRSMNEQVVRIVKLWYSSKTKRKQVAPDVPCAPVTTAVAG